MNKHRLLKIYTFLFTVVTGITVLLSCAKKDNQPLVFKYEPSEPKAFAYLPRDKYGVIDWVKAIQEEVIKPKDSLDMNQRMTGVLDLDVYFESKGGMPGVMYPHKPHTQWLDCTNCHPKIFKMQRGSNPITMLKIVSGEYCGRCHGKVAFPLSNCLRCHSQPAKGPDKVKITTIPDNIDKITDIIKKQEKDVKN